MTNQDSEKFAELCALMSQAFDREISEALMLIYFDGLKDFAIGQVESAVRLAVRSLKFMPKVAELRQLIEGGADDRAAQAWAAFLEASADGGQASVQFADRATAAAMDAVFGGWVPACRLLAAGWVNGRGDQEGGCTDEMLAHYQKSFLRQHIAALNNHRDVELYRPGLSEMSLRERGASWSARMLVLVQPVLVVGAAKTLTVKLPFDVAAGRLTDEAARQLAGDWNDLKALAAAQKPQASGQKVLPPAEEEMAAPGEVAALKASIAGLISPRPKRTLAPPDLALEEQSAESEETPR